MLDPYLTQADQVVLSNLFEDVNQQMKAGGRVQPNVNTATINGAIETPVTVSGRDKQAIECLRALNDPKDSAFQPTVFVAWDNADIHPVLNNYLVRPYARLGAGIVRHPTDVVFLTNLLMYCFVNIPSALFLFWHFTYLHGVAHALFTLWCTGSFTLMLHNHIHNGGVLAKQWSWLDFAFPYVTEPLMGHTWDSYYLHHVKHHHVEGNGPDDLSSTIRYQRDDLWHFLHYFGRFLFFVWLELPIYFMRNKKYSLAARSLISELSSYAFLYYMTRIHWRACTFAFIIPFLTLRLGMMIGNWGQHALVDEVSPASSFRSSITLIDIASNRFAFNDGYHTAHHLNPLRHWREHPVHFLKSKEAYRDGRALVFHNIDYLMLTYRLLRKDYMHLAKCLVPMGDQIGMSQQEIADMLKTKTKRFTEEDIRQKFK